MKKLKERLNWLCNLPTGEIWTEYHWREAEQIRRELEKLVEEQQKEIIELNRKLEYRENRYHESVG